MLETGFYIYSDGQDASVLCETCFKHKVQQMNIPFHKCVTCAEEINNVESTYFCPTCVDFFNTEEHSAEAIFTVCEWDYYPTCDSCFAECDTVSLLEREQEIENEF